MKSIFRKGFFSRHGLMLALIGFALIYHFPNLFILDNLGDEGFLLEGTRRLLRGDYPVADFHAYPPLAYLFPAISCSLLGFSIPSFRLGCLVIVLTCVVLTYIISKKLIVRKGMSLFPALILLLAPGPWFKAQVHFIILINTLAGILLLEKPSLKRMFFLWLAAGLTFCIRTEFVLPVILGSLVLSYVLFMEHWNAKKGETILVALLGLACFPGLCMFWYAAAWKLGPFLCHVNDVISSNNAKRYLLPFSFPTFGAFRPFWFPVWYYGGLVTYLVGLFCLFSHRFRDSLHAKGIAVIIFYGLLFSPNWIINPDYSHFLQSNGLLYVLFFFLAAHFSELSGVFSNTNLVLFKKEHQRIVYFLPILIVIVFFADSDRYFSRPGFSSYSGSFLPLIQANPSKMRWFPEKHLLCFAPDPVAKEVRALLSFGDKNKGETLLPLTYTPFVNYVTEMRNPTWHLVVYYLRFASGYLSSDQVIHDIKMKKIDFLVSPVQ